MTKARRDRIALAALALAALALRLAFLIDYDEDIDALRFRLGVERFDVAEHRPHAPFYPVYIVVAKLFTLAGASPRIALGLVGAVSGAALVVVTALLAFEVLGRRAAVIAGALALASPMLWLTSEKLLSDMAGAAVFTSALWLAARARHSAEAAPALRTAALVLFGVGLGVRLSYFPFAIASLFVIARAEGGARALAARARDLLTGVVLWLVPLVLVAGPRPLVAATWVQAVGHFTRWGGSAITVSSPLDRLYGATWGLWANALGGAWIDAPRARWIGAPLLVILLAAAARRGGARAARRAQPELVAAAIAYAAWVMLGQNIAYKPRHLLPLTPLAIVALAAGADALAARRPRRAAALAGVLAAQWFADGAALVAAHKSPSPAAALVDAARAGAGGAARPIVTRELGRMLAEGAPARRVIIAPSDAALVEAVLAAGPTGALITSEALSPAASAALEARGVSLTPIFARPRSRYVDSLWSELTLLEARPTAPR